MFSQKSWKLWPLAAFVALMALVLVPGGVVTPPGARADVESIDADDTEIEDGGETTITITLDGSSSGTVTVTATGADNVDMDVDDCTPNCSTTEEDQSIDASLTFTTNDLEEIVLTLTADCADPDTITVTATQDGVSEEVDIDCGGSSASGNVVIILDADGGTNADDFDFEISGTGTTCDDTDTLNDGDEWGLDCDNGTFTITQDGPAGWTLKDIDCTDVGISTGDIDIDIAGGDVRFVLGTGDEIECTFVNEKGAATGGTASALTVSAGPNSVNCSGSSFITIVAKNSAGNNVADGTAIQVSTNLGSVNPSSATTQTGGVLILFTAPASQGGTATITARSGSIQATTSVTVNCAQAAPTQAPPAATGGTIRAPSTGDGGLVGQADGGNTAVYAGLAVIAGSALLGALAVARVKA